MTELTKEKQAEICSRVVGGTAHNNRRSIIMSEACLCSCHSVHRMGTCTLCCRTNPSTGAPLDPPSAPAEAVVTREHRLKALECLCVPRVLDELGSRTRAWVDTGEEHARHDPAATLVAKALAEAGSRVASSRADALMAAERELVKAALDWQDYDERHDPKAPGWSSAPVVGFLQAVARLRSVAKGGG